MPIVPGRFDEHVAEMRVAGFGDRALDTFGAAGVLRGNEAHKGHRTRGIRKAVRITQFGGNREGGQVIHAAEAAEPLDAGSERREREEFAELEIDRPELRDAFVDGADIGAVGLGERGQIPVLGLEPFGMALGPGFLGEREPAAMSQQEMGEAVPGSKQVGPQLAAASEEIADRFFLLGRNMNRGERAGAIEDGQLASIAAVRFDACTGAPRNQRGGDHVTRDVAGRQEPL